MIVGYLQFAFGSAVESIYKIISNTRYYIKYNDRKWNIDAVLDLNGELYSH